MKESFTSYHKDKLLKEIKDERKLAFKRLSDNGLSMLIMSAIKAMSTIHQGDKDYEIKQFKEDILNIVEFQGHIIEALRDIKEPFK